MDNKPNFKKLNDLINSLEMKEAIENGDMGLINFGMKRIAMMIQELTALHGEDKLLQEKILDANLQQSKSSAKVFFHTQEQFAKLSNSISKLSERVNLLEEAKK